MRSSYLVAGVAAAGAGILVVRSLQRRAEGETSGGAGSSSRWRSVTILRAPEEVMPGGQLPAPLAALGDLVEVEVAAAPGGRGSELRARLRNAEPTGAASALARVKREDPRQQVRAALREAKQLLEVGEVLRVDPVPHGERKNTPGGALIEYATRRASGEGLL
jgi:hypothetical protein